MAHTVLFTYQRVFICLIAALAFGVGGMARGQEVATLTDISGAVLKLQDFSIYGRETPDFRYRGFHEGTRYFRGGAVFENAPAIPIRQANGTIAFIALDMIKQFQSDGKDATVVLANGGQILGNPLAADIQGKTALGAIEVSLTKVRSLSFNPEAIKRDMDRLEEENRSLGWPSKPRAEVTLLSGEQISLGGLAFVYEYEESDCDERYIPCRPRSFIWWNAGDIPVRVGESDVEAGLSTARSIEVTGRSKPGAGPAGLNIRLPSGEMYAATFQKLRKPIGFIGTTSYGFAHIPIRTVKVITIAD